MIPLSYLAFSADYCWVSQSNVRYSKVTSTGVSTVEVTLRIYVSSAGSCKEEIRERILQFPGAAKPNMLEMSR